MGSGWFLLCQHAGRSGPPRAGRGVVARQGPPPPVRGRRRAPGPARAETGQPLAAPVERVLRPEGRGCRAEPRAGHGAHGPRAARYPCPRAWRCAPPAPRGQRPGRRRRRTGPGGWPVEEHDVPRARQQHLLALGRAPGASYWFRTVPAGCRPQEQDLQEEREKQMHKDPMDGASTLWRFPKWKGSAWTTESALSWMWNTPGSLGTRSNWLVVFDLSYVLVEVECSYLHLSLVPLLLGFCET